MTQVLLEKNKGDCVYKLFTNKRDVDRLVESYLWIIDLPRVLEYFGDNERHGYGSGPLEE